MCYSYRFTQIAVDPQVKVPGGKAYDVLFIGTGKHFRKFPNLFKILKKNYLKLF